MATKAQIKAVDRYNKENTKAYCIRLNKTTDKDIIETLDNLTGSKLSYIKQALRAYNGGGN